MKVAASPQIYMVYMGRYEKNVVAPRSAFWLSKFKETWNDGASHKI